MNDVTVVMIIVCFINIHAQDKNFEFLRGVKEFIVEMDYSQARFDKELATDYFMIENERDPNYEAKYKKEMLNKFIVSTNSYLPDGCQVRENSQSAKYKIVVKVIKLDKNRNTNADILISIVNSSEILAKFSVYGAAGKFGSFTNLSGDAMKNVGKNTGNFLAKKVE